MNIQTAPRHTASGRIRILLSVLTAVAFALMGLTAPATAAGADITQHMTFADIKITKSGSGNEQLQVGDTARIELQWTLKDDTIERQFAEGDEFRIYLPSVFIRESGTEFTIKDDGENPVATCSVNEDSSGKVFLKCTFLKFIEGKISRTGNLWFEVRAQKAHTSETVNLVINGESVVVDLPGEGGVDPGDEEPFVDYPGTSTYKFGFDSGEPYYLRWQGRFNTSALGQNPVIVDELGAGQRFVTESVPGTVIKAPVIYKRLLNANNEEEWATDSTWINAVSDFNWDYNEDFTVLTLTPKTGSLSLNMRYTFEYSSEVIDRSAWVSGQSFTNKMNLSGIKVGSTVEVKNTGGGTGTGTELGSFTIAKEVVGEAAVDPDYAYNFEYQINGVTQKIQVKAGDVFQSLKYLDATNVKIREVVPEDTKEIDWLAPKFSLGTQTLERDQDGWISIDLKAKESLSVQVVNTADVPTDPTPTPTDPTPTPTDPTPTPTPTDPTPTPTDPTPTPTDPTPTPTDPTPTPTDPTPTPTDPTPTPTDPTPTTPTPVPSDPPSGGTTPTPPATSTPTIPTPVPSNPPSGGITPSTPNGPKSSGTKSSGVTATPSTSTNRELPKTGANIGGSATVVLLLISAGILAVTKSRKAQKGH